MLLCVWCTGPKKFLLEISLCVCDVLAVLAQKSFCWEFLCVCVWCTGPIKVFVGKMLLCVWCTGPKKFLLEISLCVCDVLAVLAQKSFCWEFLSVCVMYWPYKSFCWKCFSLCVCVLYWPYKSLCWKCFSVCDVLAL